MGRVRDVIDDAGWLLLAAFAIKVLGSWKRDPWWLPEYSDKGGRGAGPGATTTPVPQGGADLWSEETMRLFVAEMEVAGINPRLVLLGIAAASFFNADAQLGSNVGLLLVSRDHLRELNGPWETFETLNAPQQIPWIGRVIQLRLAQQGGAAPDNVGDLAVLLHPASPAVAEVIRTEANRRATAADQTMLYIAHDNLLRHVLANPLNDPTRPPLQPGPWGPWSAP
jgi:hypothetical protein